MTTLQSAERPVFDSQHCSLLNHADCANDVGSRPRIRTEKHLGLGQAGMPCSLQTAIDWSSAVESNHDLEDQSLASSPLDERS